jgi:serine/threonine protein kinase
MAYMSPEVYTGRELGFGIDMWALGCILFVIWTHHRLYDSVGDRCYQFFIQEGGLEMSDDDLNIDYWMAVPGLPPDYLPILDRLPRVHEMTFKQRSLLAQMLRIDPSQRIQPQDVLNHPWFQEQLQQL